MPMQITESLNVAIIVKPCLSPEFANFNPSDEKKCNNKSLLKIRNIITKVFYKKFEKYY